MNVKCLLLSLSIRVALAIIEVMDIGKFCGMYYSPVEAVAIQARLSPLVIKSGNVPCPKFIAGVDISSGRAGELATAAVVVLAYPEMKVVAVEVAHGELKMPYIPGLLSFRELPLITKALAGLAVTPDLMFVDGQGLAHLRRLGLACHLGLVTGLPTIGCAKSRLCGQSEPPGKMPGSFTFVKDGEEIIGAEVRTKSDVRTLYISTGHKISLDSAVNWVLRCCRGYRLPEPIRMAHQAAGGNLKMEKQIKEKVCQR